MKTVVGLVASYRKAEALIQELTLRGFGVEDILRIGTYPGEVQKEEEISCRIEEFFGTEEKVEMRGYYAECLRKGAVLVSVFVEDEDVDRAVEIMVGHDVADVGGCAGLDQTTAPGLDETGVAWDETLSEQVVRGRVRVYNHSSARAIGEGFAPPRGRAV